MEYQRLVRPLRDYQYEYDIKEIREGLNALGYDASDSDIQWAYSQYDDGRAAGWLILPDKKEEFVSVPHNLINLLEEEIRQHD